MTKVSKRVLLSGAIPLALLIGFSPLVRGYEDLPKPKANPKTVAPAPVPRPVPSNRAPAAPLTAPPQIVIPQAGNEPPPKVVVPSAPNVVVPPAPNANVPPVGPRGDQLEGFQRLGKQLFDNFVNPGAANGQPQQPAVQPNQLNAGLKQMLERLTSGDRAIESLKIQFDPQETDFAADKAKINAEVGLRHSAWSKSPSRLVLGLGARMESPENTPSRAVVGGELTIQTDVVALANHLLPKIKKLMGVESDGRIVVEGERPSAERTVVVQNDPRRPLIGRLLRGPNVTVQVAQAPALEKPVDVVAAAPAAIDNSFKSQLQQKLARTGTLNSMDDVVDLFTYVSGLSICIQNEKIENLTAAVANAQGDFAKKQAMQDLAEARAKRDAMLYTRLSVNRDAEGIARGIEIQMNDSAVVTGTRIENLHVVVGEQEVKVSGSTRMFQGLDLYPFVKPLVMTFLRNVQNQDAILLDLQNGPFSGFWRQGREAVIGPPEAVPAPQ